MARRSWIADRTDDLERELALVGLSAPRAELERKLREHVATVAEQMRTSVQAARRYFTPETMRILAQRFAEQLADEAPGLDLVGAPRDCSVPLRVVGALIAGLTEVVQLDDAAGRDAGCALLSTVGVMLRDHDHATLGVVDLPWALLTRTARVLDNAADQVRRGAPLPSGADEAIRHHFADRLADDATVLRQLGDNRSDPPPRPPLRAV